MSLSHPNEQKLVETNYAKQPEAIVILNHKN